ncbi:MAG: hypothetical protein VX024_04975 [SAR324 cluster bacterium]|nr:hypothetical protein [SAR324 cluster bacterium]
MISKQVEKAFTNSLDNYVRYCSKQKNGQFYLFEGEAASGRGELRVFPKSGPSNEIRRYWQGFSDDEKITILSLLCKKLNSNDSDIQIWRKNNDIQVIKITSSNTWRGWFDEIDQPYLFFVKNTVDLENDDIMERITFYDEINNDSVEKEKIFRPIWSPTSDTTRDRGNSVLTSSVGDGDDVSFSCEVDQSGSEDQQKSFDLLPVKGEIEDMKDKSFWEVNTAKLLLENMANNSRCWQSMAEYAKLLEEDKEKAYDLWTSMCHNFQSMSQAMHSQWLTPENQDWLNNRNVNNEN